MGSAQPALLDVLDSAPTPDAAHECRAQDQTESAAFSKFSRTLPLVTARRSLRRLCGASSSTSGGRSSKCELPRRPAVLLPRRRPVGVYVLAAPGSRVLRQGASPATQPAKVRVGLARCAQAVDWVSDRTSALPCGTSPASQYGKSQFQQTAISSLCSPRSDIVLRSSEPAQAWPGVHSLLQVT
jgi:hypothetical protein